MKSIRPTESSSAGSRDHRARAVAENHAGSAVGVVDDRRHHVRPDHQNPLVRPGGDELGSRLQGVEEGRAGRRKIESPGPLGPQLVLHQAGGGGKKHVGRHRAHDDGFDIGGRQPALGQSLLRGFDSQVAGGHSLVYDVALADAHAGHDPFVVGVDHFFEIGVGEQARRHVGAEGADFGANRFSQLSAPEVI